MLWERCRRVRRSVCSAGENRGKRARTCEMLCGGRALALYCFQQMGFREGEGGWRGGAEEGCMRLCCVRSGAAGGPAAVSSSSVCQQVNSPSIPAASRTSAKMTGHAPLFTHSRSLSICSSTAADSFCFCFYPPLSTSVPSLSGQLPPVFVSPSRCDTPHSSDSYWLTSFLGSRTVT